MISYNPIEVLFQIGNFKVYSWGFVFVIAFLIAFFLVLREAKKQEIKQKHVYNLALLILVGTIMGTRLFYVFEHFNFFVQNPAQILLTWQGGLTSYGAFLTVFFVWFYIKKNKLKFAQILDILAPYIILAIAIIRIGCFLRGCCGGQETMLPWAVNGLHPTQLYESLYSFIIFLVLLKFKRLRKDDKAKNTKFKQLIKKQGALFLSFLIFYSFFRFFNDFFRAYENYWLGLALSQWILLGIFVLSLIILKLVSSNKRKDL